MSDFNFDIDAELKSIRGDKKLDVNVEKEQLGEVQDIKNDEKVISNKSYNGSSSSSSTASQSTQTDNTTSTKQDVDVDLVVDEEVSDELTDETREQKTEVIEEEIIENETTSDQNEEVFETNKIIESDVANKKKRKNTGTLSADFENFIPLKNMFDFVGGDKKVVLNPNLKEIVATGLYEPFYKEIQEMLKSKFLGSVISFPWGDYTITEDNKVFSSNKALSRFLMFDALRYSDENLGEQFAKQWVALQFPIFDEYFDPNVHMNRYNDELDVYSLVVVSSSVGHTTGQTNRNRGRKNDSERSFSLEDKINMTNSGISYILGELKAQNKRMEKQFKKDTIVQTVVLLDRMGLLKGGIPKDIKEFIRVLELNRDLINDINYVMDTHSQNEVERDDRIKRDEINKRKSIMEKR